MRAALALRRLLLRRDDPRYFLAAVALLALADSATLETKMRYSPLIIVPLVLFSQACDPVAPGASGQLSLAPDIDLSSYATLVMRAYVSDSPWNVSMPPSSPRDPRENLWLIEPLEGLTFPYDYYLQGPSPLGTTKSAGWRLVAWLTPTSAEEAFGTWIESGQPYGTRLFEIGDCGSYDLEYCDVTENVDLLIDSFAP